MNDPQEPGLAQVPPQLLVEALLARLHLAQVLVRRLVCEDLAGQVPQLDLLFGK